MLKTLTKSSLFAPSRLPEVRVRDPRPLEGARPQDQVGRGGEQDEPDPDGEPVHRAGRQVPGDVLLGHLLDHTGTDTVGDDADCERYVWNVTSIQGGPSCRGQAFVDIAIRDALQYSLGRQVSDLVGLTYIWGVPTAGGLLL